MMKVQNGWEACSLQQVEHLSNDQLTPSSDSPARTSRRHSLSSESYITSPTTVNAPVKGINSPSSHHYQHYSVPNKAPASGPSLSDPFEGSGMSPHTQRATSRRTTNKRVPQPLSARHKYNGDDPLLPRTPAAPDRSSLTRDSLAQNQAERDAIDSLLFMSSPNNSGNARYWDRPHLDPSQPS